MSKTIYIASDHAGFEVKTEIVELLKRMGYDYEDLGPSDDKSVDYPIYAKRVCDEVLRWNARGILICGSGTGMQIAANKFKGIRAAFSYDVYSAHKAREDNDANILTLRAREFDDSLYGPILVEFLDTDFLNLERHEKRIQQITDIEHHKNIDHQKDI